MVELILVIGYIIVTTAIGWILSTRAKARNDINSFFVGKKELSGLLVCFIMFGEMIAGSSTVGSAQTAFNLGLSSAWTNWGQSLGVFVFVLTVSKLYRVAGYHGAYSVPEAFEFRFDSRRCRMVVMVIVLVVYGILFAMQPKAAANILAPMINVDVTVMTWVMGIIFVIQALVGLKGIAAMNVVHSSILYIGCVVVGILAWNHVGSLDIVRETLGGSYLSVTQPSVSSVIGNAAGGLFAFILSTSLVANIYSAKSKKTANAGVLAAAILVIIFAFFPALIGIFGKIMYPDAEAGTIFYTVADTFGPAIGALASMAIIAAVFSTAPAFLLTLSTTLTRDFYLAVLNKNATDKQQLRFSKWAIVGIGVIATFLGIYANSILTQVNGAFQIRAVAGMVLVIAAYWKKVDKNSAFWSMLIGGIVAAVWHFAGQPFGIVPFWPGCGTGLVILVVMTALNGKKVSDDYARYKALMDAVPANEL